MLIEDGIILTGGDTCRVELARLTDWRVPPTLTGMLQARLDSLSPLERTELQRASVVGRIFWDDTVARLDESGVGRQTETLYTTFHTLRRREMIFQREPSAFAGTQEYIFKHALLREVTYESVLKRLRRVYHGLVAEWLMNRSRDRLEEYTGLIADHLEQAGRSAEAVPYLRRAGEQAQARFANAEAVVFLGRALALQPDTAVSERYELLLAREAIYNLDLLKFSSEFMSLSEPGGLIVLEMESNQYSFNDISKLVETTNAQITQLNTSNDPETGMMQETLRINKPDISDVVAAFQRHEYNVEYFFGEELYTNELRSNYDNLMNYLKI